MLTSWNRLPAGQRRTGDVLPDRDDREHDSFRTPSICCDSAGAAGQALITSTKGLDSAPEVGSSMRSR